MTKEEAQEYAKSMTYSDAVDNALQGRAIPFRKATMIKLWELVEIAEKLDKEKADAVNREDARRLHCKICRDYCTCYRNPETCEDLKAFDSLPSVKPQPKTGHWIVEVSDWLKWTCSECGFSKRTDVHVRLGYDHCPKCGARMTKKER